MTRLPRFSDRSNLLLLLAFSTAVAGLFLHGTILRQAIFPGGALLLSLADTASFIGLQLALIAVLGAVEPSLRGLCAGLLVLAAAAAALTGSQSVVAPGDALSWQLQAHVLISLFAYGLLTVGAIVAVYALVQERRLRSARITAMNQVFAPLETTEKLLFGITAAGFSVLLLSVLSGFVFVDNLFAQHLVHKTALSIAALLLFGILIAGRQLAGWRGKRAVYLYLWGFAILGLAYFGSRYVLEIILGRTWG